MIDKRTVVFAMAITAMLIILAGCGQAPPAPESARRRPEASAAHVVGNAVCRRSEQTQPTCLQLPEVISHMQPDESGYGDVVAVGLNRSYILKTNPEITHVLTVPTAPDAADRIIVDKTANMLYWYKAGRFQARYRVATGRLPQYTPEGIFPVAVKIAEPPDQDILKPQLGTRWLGLAVPPELDQRPKPDDMRAPLGQKYGIHGTDEPESIGAHASGGCIRMQNEDILQLYDQVSLGTLVEIRP